MRRRLASSALCTGPTWMGRRGLRPQYSPDRTHDERIQDVQNAFSWSAKHIFRPHQHFTYDPSSWSRPLEESVKKQRKLVLLERLRFVEEREAERVANRKAINEAERISIGATHHSAQTQQTVVATPSARTSVAVDVREPLTSAVAAASPPEDVPDYFFSLEDSAPPLASAGPQEEPKAATPLTRCIDESDDTITSTNNNTTIESISLQELLDAVRELRQLLKSPRFANNASLRVRERQRKELELVLRHLFARVQHAVVGTTLTLDAFLFSWYVLIDNAEFLLTALGHSPASAAEVKDITVVTEEVVTSVWQALEQTLLPLLDENGVLAETEGQLPSLEALIEALFVLTHPFTSRAALLADSDRRTQPTQRQIEGVAKAVQHALIARMTSADSEMDGTTTTTSSSEEEAQLKEWMDTAHLSALLLALERSLKRVGGNDSGTSALYEVVAEALPRLASSVKLNAKGVLQALRGATAERTARHQLRASLHPLGSTHSTDATATTASPSARSFASNDCKPVALDDTGSPSGVQPAPPTDADEIRQLMQAAVCLVWAAASVLAPLTSPSSSSIGSLSSSSARVAILQHQVESAVDAVLVACSYAPNYDLHQRTLVQLACALIETGLASEWNRAEALALPGEAERPLRLALLLSRVTLDVVGESVWLCRLMRALCTLSPPAYEDRQRTLEWRRLRGVTMQRLLTSITAAQCVRFEEDHRCETTWEELLAFGLFSGPLPLRLWKDACRIRFGPEHVRGDVDANETHLCSRGTAEAILVLRTRLTGHHHQPQHQQCSFGLTQSEVTSLARAAQVISRGKLSAETLLSKEETWESVMDYFSHTSPQNEEVTLLLGDAAQFVRKNRQSQYTITVL